MPRGRLGRPGVVVIPRICRDTVVERLDTEWVAKELGQVLRWEIRIAMKVSPLIALYGPEEPGGQRLTATDYLCMLHLTKILSQDWHWPGWKAKSMNRSSQTSYRYCEPLESLALFQGLTNVSALQQCFQSLMARPIMQGERLHACLSYICAAVYLVSRFHFHSGPGWLLVLVVMYVMSVDIDVALGHGQLCGAIRQVGRAHVNVLSVLTD